ncbi:MAG TPA: hypothetical protein VKB78_01475 [Pirellulales bacterium]|nr:hypothetical protein [Pirellulales bacterium]
MSSDESIEPHDFQADLKPLEAALGSLVPATSRIDRDRLMYLSGAASADATVSTTKTTIPSARSWRGRTLRAFWPLAAAAMLIVSIGLGTIVAFWEPRERVVYIERQVAQGLQSLPRRIASGALALEVPSHWMASRASVDASYLVLRGQVLRRGVAALDTPATGKQSDEGREPSNRALLNELLGG